RPPLPYENRRWSTHAASDYNLRRGRRAPDRIQTNDGFEWEDGAGSPDTDLLKQLLTGLGGHYEFPGCLRSFGIKARTDQRMSRLGEIGKKSDCCIGGHRVAFDLSLENRRRTGLGTPILDIREVAFGTPPKNEAAARLEQLDPRV